MTDRRMSVDGMGEAIAQSMAEYADLSNKVMKRSVTEASRSVIKDIQAIPHIALAEQRGAEALTEKMGWGLSH